MALSATDIKKIAHLARLALPENEIAKYTEELAKIFTYIEQMNQLNTTDIIPMSHSLDLQQPLRPDVITESDQRALFQSIAPAVAAGLYLVPKVIE